MRRMFTEKQVKNLAGKKIEEVVPEMIQADKDVLSQIVYDGENMTIIFPKYVMPLRIRTNDDYYFDYKTLKIRDDSGDVVEGVAIADSDDNIIIECEEEFLFDSIYDIQYIQFNGNSICLLNAYDLYYQNFELSQINLNILNKCQVSYDSVDAYLEVTLPKNVLPLDITIRIFDASENVIAILNMQFETKIITANFQLVQKDVRAIPTNSYVLEGYSIVENAETSIVISDEDVTLSNFHHADVLFLTYNIVNGDLES